jgi:phospholipid-transporting ATPase
MTVCLKAALVTHTWTWVTHLAIWGSIIAWFIFLIIYRYVKMVFSQIWHKNLRARSKFFF